VLGRKWTACLAVAVLALSVDQVAKWLIVQLVPLGEPLTLAGGLLTLAQLRQEGAAFGLLGSFGPDRLRQLLPAFAGLSALLLGALLWRAPRGDVLSGTAIGLIFGGAAANLLDRMRFDAVIEFVQLDLRVLQLPDFNLADCAIAAGMALLLLDLVASEAGVRQTPD
jgi:signal peptidase II